MSNIKFEVGFIAVFILLMVGIIGTAIGFGVSQSFGNEQAQVCTVQDKDRTTTKEGGSDMRIYTEECGVVQVGDLFFRGQFDTANTYSDIEVGETYEFTTVGNRVPFFSLFPTILGDVTEVN